MSGEAGGAIVGGLLILAAAPMILAGAAVGGAIYGGVKLAQALFIGAKKNQAAKQIEVDHCSQELQSMYAKIQQAVQRQEALDQQYYQKVAAEMEKATQELKAFAENQPETQDWERKLADARQKMAAQLGEEKEQALAKIRKETQDEVQDNIERLEKMHAETAKMVNWEQQDARGRAMQKTVAEQMLQDARASISLLKRISAVSSEAKLDAQADALAQNLQRAEDAFEKGIYQMVAASAQQIVTKSASLALAYAQEEQKRNELEMELMAKVEALAEELKVRRVLHIEDPSGECLEEAVEEDLDEFCQGHLEAMQQQLEATLQKLKQSGENRYSYYELVKLMQEFDNVTEPNARLILKTAEQTVLSYYEKLHAMEVIADFMKEQNYELDWAHPIGDDLSQKLVVHFVNQMTGNRVAITLDSNMNDDEIEKMSMELMMFYDSGREVTEEEKQTLRRHLVEALHAAKLGGNLACQGAVNAPSPRVAMDDEAQVANMAPTPLFVNPVDGQQ